MCLSVNVPNDSEGQGNFYSIGFVPPPWYTFGENLSDKVLKTDRHSGWTDKQDTADDNTSIATGLRGKNKRTRAMLPTRPHKMLKTGNSQCTTWCNCNELNMYSADIHDIALLSRRITGQPPPHRSYKQL